VYARELEVA
jgi:hypothetical protein